MAELHVERKEQNIWPWILIGVLLLALILWFIFGRGDRTPGPFATDTDTTTFTTAPAAAVPATDGTPAAVSDYLQFVEQQSGPADGRTSHDYTADGLRRLTAALTAVSDRDTVGAVAVQSRIDEIRQRADAMQQNPESTEHARQAREAFVMTAGVMEQMQGPARAQGEVTEVRTAAEAINPAGLLLDQKAQVDRFFERSGAALRTMTGRT